MFEFYENITRIKHTFVELNRSVYSNVMSKAKHIQKQTKYIPKGNSEDI